MRNFKCIVSYDGYDYLGWQRQDKGLTVQGVLEKHLSILLNEDIKIHGSGRTDRGVHALGQVFSFNTNSTIPTENIKRVLNRRLPDSIYLKSIEEMDMDFHARYSAKGKKYVYKIAKIEKNPMISRYYLFLDEDIDTKKIIEAKNIIIGKHDFISFMSASTVKNTVREIYSIDIYEDDKFIEIEFYGNGFLYNMVRIIVKHFINIGLSKLTKEEFKEILESKKRLSTHKTARANGLYLKEVIF